MSNPEGEGVSKSSVASEIEQLQRVLGKARVNIHNKVLYKAFMMPEDMPAEGRSYPTPAYGLMERVAEEKKKKKKKKRRRREPSVDSAMEELL